MRRARRIEANAGERRGLQGVQRSSSDLDDDDARIRRDSRTTCLNVKGASMSRDAEPLHDVERRTEHVAADEDAEELAERHDGG